MRGSGRGRRRRPCWRTSRLLRDGWPGPAGICLQAARTGPTARSQRGRRPGSGRSGCRGGAITGIAGRTVGCCRRRRWRPAWRSQRPCIRRGSGVRRPSASCMPGTWRCSRAPDRSAALVGWRGRWRENAVPCQNSSSLAIAAPSASARSFATTISASTTPYPAKVAKPQTVPAIIRWCGFVTACRQDKSKRSLCVSIGSRGGASGGLGCRGRVVRGREAFFHRRSTDS